MNLERFFQLCNPATTLNVANPSDKNLYIDFSSVRSGNLISEFMRTIKLHNQSFTCQFFSGHIGCGKTTELLRLKSELEAEKYHVVYFESSEFLDFSDVDITDILLLIVRKISESMKESGLNINPGYFQTLFKNISGLFSDLQLEHIEFNMGLTTISTKLKDSNSMRKKLRAELEPRTDNIIDSINEEVLKAANEKIKSIGKKGLVVIIDNLDRIYNVYKTKRRTQPEYIFIDRGDQLQRLFCHLVYTIPLALTFSNDASTITNRCGKPKTLSMVPILTRDGKTYFKKSMSLMQVMILTRAFPDLSSEERFKRIKNIFEPEILLTKICLASGGHVRNLLNLVYTCLSKYDPPFTTKIYNEVIREFRDDLVRKIDPNEWEMLKHVQKNQTVVGEKDFKELLRGMFVFEYHDKDGVWYGVNPLLKGARQLNT